MLEYNENCRIYFSFERSVNYENKQKGDESLIEYGMEG